MESPIYAVCEHCQFLRAYAQEADGAGLPERCPACGHEITFHGRRERFPSTYVGRVARGLHRTPPLNV